MPTTGWPLASGTRHGQHSKAESPSACVGAQAAKDVVIRIFVAGATVAVDLPPVRALCTLGHQVTGMTRAGPGVDRLRDLSASAADAFDPKAVRDAAAPYAAVDQLT